MGKRWIFAPLLAAAVAGPPLLMNEDGRNASTEATQAALFQNQFWQGQSAPGQNSLVQQGDSPAISGLSSEESALLDLPVRHWTVTQVIACPW